MKGRSSRRGLTNVALNGLVSAGVIVGSERTTQRGKSQMRCTVTSLSGAHQASIRAKVLQALGGVGKGAEIVIEPNGRQAARR